MFPAGIGFDRVAESEECCSLKECQHIELMLVATKLRDRQASKEQRNTKLTRRAISETIGRLARRSSVP